MPITSVRDLVIHGDDLVAATYGRAFWILDDLTPLRQIDRRYSIATALLFRPEKALRVRLDLNQDTPMPPEMPAGQNPPNGAIIDYYLNVHAIRRTSRWASTTAPASWCASTPPSPKSADARAAAQRSRLLAGPSRAAHPQRRPEPLRLGSALRRAARAAPRISHLRAVRQHARPAAGRDGDARQLQRAAHCEWPQLTSSR